MEAQPRESADAVQYHYDEAGNVVPFEPERPVSCLCSARRRCSAMVVVPLDARRVHLL
jgi:hypothetical protein